MIRLITQAAKSFFVFVFSIYLRKYIYSKNSLKTISLYSKGDEFLKVFTKIRFWDAPYVEIEKLVPKRGVIIDLGCGEGLFSNFLAISSSTRKVIGIDKDKDRISKADKGLVNTKFVEGDITTIEIPAVDVITIVHVLHHLNSLSQQEELIRSCSKKLKPKGKLIIVEAEPKISFKYFLVLLTDHFIVPVLFEKRLYSPIFFRTKKSWMILLDLLGLKVTGKSEEKGKPFTHVIFIASKK